MPRTAWLVCLFCLGCQSVSGLPSIDDVLSSSRTAATPRSDTAPLQQAEQALKAGDQEAACEHLRRYADANPESALARVFHAEVLFRLARVPEARAAFEHALAGLQGQKAHAEALFHCHGRLLDLAADEADEFAIHLHRGVGLYLLALRRQNEPDPEGDVPVEAILCKAIIELTQAHEALPESARPCWYLHLAFRHLGQSAAAQRWLRECRERAALSYLTSHERQGLELRTSTQTERLR